MRRLFLTLFVFLAFCGQTHATITAGKNGIHQCTSATACTAGSSGATTAGSLVVVMTQENQSNTCGGTCTASFSDGTSNTYTQLGSNTCVTGSQCIAIFYSTNAASISATGITCTWSGSLSTTVFCEWQEFLGAATSSPLDPNASNPVTNTPSGSSTSVVSGSLSTNKANAVLVHFVFLPANVSTWTSTGGFTVQSLNNVHAALAYLIVSATQSSTTVTMSWNNSNGSRVSIFAAWDAPSSGPPANQAPRQQ